MRQLLFVILTLLPLFIFGQSENRNIILDGIDKMLEKEYEQSLELLAQAKILAEEKSNYAQQCI